MRFSAMCQLNPYLPAATGFIVNEIQCPHCDDDVELEDGDFGLFNCPHCDKEFPWDSDSKKLVDNIVKWMNIVGAVISVIGLIGVVGILILFQFDPPSGYEGLIIVVPIGIILIGLSINLIAGIIWCFNKVISIEEQSPSPEVITFFGLTIFFIFCGIIFWL